MLPHIICSVLFVDHVFGAAVQTWEIFNMLAKPIIESVMEGFNGTIFAYGQTSSGKTHTMMGCEEDIGITPLTVQAIFSYIDEVSVAVLAIKPLCVVLCDLSHKKERTAVTETWTTEF